LGIQSCRGNANLIQRGQAIGGGSSGACHRHYQPEWQRLHSSDKVSHVTSRRATGALCQELSQVADFVRGHFSMPTHSWSLHEKGRFTQVLSEKLDLLISIFRRRAKKR